MRQTTDRPSAPSLRAVWLGTVARLVVLMAALGAVAVGAVWSQQSAVTGTTRQLESRVAAQADLTRAITDINDDAVSGMLYGLDTFGGLDGQQVEYLRIRSDIEAAFDAMSRIDLSPDAVAHLEHARATWVGIDAAIATAPDAVASGEVFEDLANGRDPWTPLVWQPLNQISGDLAAIADTNVEFFQLGVESQRRTILLTVLTVVAAVVIGLVLSISALRRIKHLVLSPLEDLREGATALRDADLGHAIELDRGSAELFDLAETLNEAAASLGASQQILREQAYTDPLTGLPNRKALNEHIETALAREGGESIALLFVDLDDFKEINDSLGHHAGDELLRIVGRRIAQQRRGDEFVARLGGDEFAVAIACSDRDGCAPAMAERLIAAIAEPVEVEGTRARVSCSIGIAHASLAEGAATADTLVRHADVAMYAAKDNGKDGYDVFDAEMHATMLARLELKRDLAGVVERDELELHYQPVVRLSTGELLGHEALVRWRHPSRGLIGPSEFIPVAEETEQIVEIGSWVLDRACRDLVTMRHRLPEGQALTVAVNMSARQLTEPLFIPETLATIARYGLDADAIVLELTEAEAVSDTVEASAALECLRRLGVRVALDDFGTGYSSLRYVDELPIDVLKIDRSFVIAQVGRRPGMLESIVDMGERLGMSMVVEGIETRSELDRLRAFGDLAGQGYYLARPAPLDEVLARHAERTGVDDVLRPAGAR